MITMKTPAISKKLSMKMLRNQVLLFFGDFVFNTRLQIVSAMKYAPAAQRSTKMRTVIMSDSEVIQSQPKSTALNSNLGRD